MGKLCCKQINESVGPRKLTVLNHAIEVVYAFLAEPPANNPARSGRPPGTRPPRRRRMRTRSKRRRTNGEEEGEEKEVEEDDGQEEEEG